MKQLRFAARFPLARILLSRLVLFYPARKVLKVSENPSMKSASKWIAGVLLFLLIGLLAYYSVKDTGQPNGKSQIVRLASISVAVDYGPYLVAKEKGWFEESVKKLGYEIEYTTFQSLPPANEAIASGKIDAIVAAEPPFIVGNAAGIRTEIVAISCSLVQEILVLSNSDINQPEMLKGKKIAVLAGSSSHYGLLKTLKDAGVDKSEFQIVSMIPPDAKAAFESGQVDAWAVWPPFVEQEEIAGIGRVLPKGDAKIHSVLGVRSEFAEERPEVTKEIVATLERAKRWLRENPDEAKKIVSKQIDVPLEVVERAWERHDWSAVLSEDVKADIQAKADFLFSEGFVKQRVNAAKLVELKFTTENIEDGALVPTGN
jgi:sulfonate transport system substrate-binding protein